MNFDGNFRKLGTADVRPIARRIAAYSEEDWRAADFRQRRYEVHRDTNTIPLVFDEDFRHTHPTRLPALAEFETALKPVLAGVAQIYERGPEAQRLVSQFGYGYFIRATLVRLRPGGRIPEHTDNNFSLVHSHRVHVPVVTNEHVSFRVGSEVRTLAAGEVVEINNRRMHEVANDGEDARVHLILDFVLPGEKCCCGRKRHPDLLCSPASCRPTDHLEIPCTCYPEETAAAG